MCKRQDLSSTLRPRDVVITTAVIIIALVVLPGCAGIMSAPARESIDKNSFKVNLEAEVGNNFGGSTYRRDWVVGDRITTQWESNRNNVRITGVEFKVSAKEEEISLTTVRKAF